MDESPKQLIEAARLPLPIKLGIDKKEDYEYIRHGVVTIFMTNESLKDQRLVEVTDFNLNH